MGKDCPASPLAMVLFYLYTLSEMRLGKSMDWLLSLSLIRAGIPIWAGLFFLSFLFLTAEGQPASGQKDKEYESVFSALKTKISAEHIKQTVYYLSQDPLPRRVLNYILPGHTSSTLEEADAWILKKLRKAGYSPRTDETKVQAFGRDLSKPLAHQYTRPPQDAPWFIAHNLIADRKGSEHPTELIVLIAHKDSQSWIASPGANDNAVGTGGLLELASVLRNYEPKHTIRFLFCNEEHTPWTSITAAEEIKSSGLEVLALINLDGIGVKPPSQKGLLTNVTRYTTAEGERLADRMALLNTRHSLGLQQTKYRSNAPGDDDGSFIKAGFPWSVLNIGSMPYGDPHYHQEGDIAEKVDYENARVTVQLTLAAVLYLDVFGRP